MYQIIKIKKFEANLIHAGLTQTTKMPCKSYSLPTEACQTGYLMAQIPGSICSKCYADKGNYRRFEHTIKPGQFARLDSLVDPHWVLAMVTSIGTDPYFRWHDSGDLQGLWHLEKIADVAKQTPNCKHWLPTREYGIVKEYIEKHGALPDNLVVRLSAMYVDKPVIIPASLQGVKNVTASNVHTITPIGQRCPSPDQGGACKDCRACWSDVTVSYTAH